MNYNHITADLIALVQKAGTPKAKPHTQAIWAEQNQGYTLPIKRFYKDWEEHDWFENHTTYPLKTGTAADIIRSAYVESGSSAHILTTSPTGPFDKTGKPLTDPGMIATVDRNDYTPGDGKPRYYADFNINSNQPRTQMHITNDGVHFPEAKASYQPVAGVRSDNGVLFPYLSASSNKDLKANINGHKNGVYCKISYCHPDRKLVVPFNNGKHEIELAKGTSNVDIQLQEPRGLMLNRTKIYIHPDDLKHIDVMDCPTSDNHTRTISFGAAQRVTLNLKMDHAKNDIVARHHGYDIIVRKSPNDPIESIIKLDYNVMEPLLDAKAFRQQLENPPKISALELEQEFGPFPEPSASTSAAALPKVVSKTAITAP